MPKLIGRATPRCFYAVNGADYCDAVPLSKRNSQPVVADLDSLR